MLPLARKYDELFSNAVPNFNRFERGLVAHDVAQIGTRLTGQKKNINLLQSKDHHKQ